ncbi:MAG: hypothetical protein U5R30_20685 [Deltaproteobacteria bacterium]|nr:hypothetical protein [Deltaproteobacteria bacterium]
MAAKDVEATAKYRSDPKFNTGGTFGVEYATLAGKLMAFNYRTLCSWDKPQRTAASISASLPIPSLEQFNKETVRKKQQRTCGEPCAAVCKKLNGRTGEKDYGPYRDHGAGCAARARPARPPSASTTQQDERLGLRRHLPPAAC